MVTTAIARYDGWSRLLGAYGVKQPKMVCGHDRA
jgi:hypothetical protein